jgi:hypothetical protein
LKFEDSDKGLWHPADVGDFAEGKVLEFGKADGVLRIFSHEHFRPRNLAVSLDKFAKLID